MPRDKNPSLSRTCLICRQKLINQLKVSTLKNPWTTSDQDSSPKKDHLKTDHYSKNNEASTNVSRWKTLLLEAFSMLFGLPADHPFVNVFTTTTITSSESYLDEITKEGNTDSQGQMCNRCLEDVSNVHYIFWQLHSLEKKLSQLQLLLFQRLRSNYDALPVGLIFGKYIGIDELLNKDLSTLKYDDLVKFLFEEIKSSREAWPKPIHSLRWKQACQNAKRITQSLLPEGQHEDIPDCLSLSNMSSAEGHRHQQVKVEIDPADFQSNVAFGSEQTRIDTKDEEEVVTASVLSKRPPSKRISAKKVIIDEKEDNDIQPDDEEYDGGIEKDEEQLLLEDDVDFEELWDMAGEKRGAKRRARTKRKPKPTKRKITANANRKGSFKVKEKNSSTEKDARFLCTEDPDNCTKTYGNKKHLRDHVEKFHKARKYVCDEVDCLDKFKTAALLDSHKEKYHDKPRPKEICELCGLSFDHKEMKRHYYFRHQGVGKFKCERCTMDFMDPSEFEEHEQLHQNAEYPFLCVVCQQLFTNSMDLKNHVTSNHLSSGLKCPICGIMKPNDFLLQRHIRIHDRVKRFPCLQCGKQFSTNAYLKYHEDHFHTNAGRKFPCEVCGKEFLHEKNVMRHLISHQEEKPFKCRICSKTFNYSHLLKKHEEIHSGTKNYECHLCGKRFKQEQNLKQHMRSHRPKPEKPGVAMGGLGGPSRKKTGIKLEEEEEDIGEISYEIHQDGGSDSIPVILQLKSDPLQEHLHTQSQLHHHLISTSTLTPTSQSGDGGEIESVIEATIIPATEITEDFHGNHTGQYETVQEIQLHSHDGSGELGPNSQTATVVFLYEYNA